MPGHSCARPGAVHSAARGSAHRGNGPCTGRSDRLRPLLGPCAAIARGSARGSIGRSRGRRTAGRAGRRLHPPSTAGRSSPPPPFELRAKALCECECALCFVQAVLGLCSVPTQSARMLLVAGAQVLGQEVGSEQNLRDKTFLKLLSLLAPRDATTRTLPSNLSLYTWFYGFSV